MTSLQKDKGQRFEPLQKEQIKKFDAAAKASKNDLTRLVTRTLLHTGMRNSEFHHMTNNWLEQKRILGKPIIRIPDQEKCIGGVGETGNNNSKGKNLHDRGQPCYKCREERDGSWHAKTSNSPRPIPVMEEEIHDSLMRWFENNEQVPLLHDAVATRVKNIAEQAGIDREVLPHDLRHTYGTMLARMKFEPAKISAAMGHSSPAESWTYINFVGKDVMNEFKEKWEFEF